MASKYWAWLINFCRIMQNSITNPRCKRQDRKEKQLFEFVNESASGQRQRGSRTPYVPLVLQVLVQCPIISICSSSVYFGAKIISTKMSDPQQTLNVFSMFHLSSKASSFDPPYSPDVRKHAWIIMRPAAEVAVQVPIQDYINVATYYETNVAHDTNHPDIITSNTGNVHCRMFSLRFFFRKQTT